MLTLTITAALILTGTAHAHHTTAHNKAVAKRAICKVFGSKCAEAMTVVACETGHTYNVWARNGQYLGLFQMGASERARFGHGNNAWAQARAAYRYYRLAGWGPWQCLPYGGLRW